MHKSGHEGRAEGGLSMLMESQEHREWGSDKNSRKGLSATHR